VDVVFAHDTEESPLGGGGVQPVAGGRHEVERIRALGMDVLLADFADPDDPRHHSRAALLVALETAV
jgi:hypothetical protein